jgi:RNase H-like domain found in reverse transcriptase
MDPAKFDTVLNWPTPHSVKDIQSFLGFANFYRQFIMSYSNITHPLIRLMKKDETFSWSNDTQCTFESLKSTFISVPVLCHFDPELHIILETNASDYTITAILSQVNENNKIHPVTFRSHSMQHAELNYDIHNKELLVVFDASRAWHTYLEGAAHTISVVTDPKNLEYFMSTKLLTHQQAQWSEYLSLFNYLITY